MKSHYLFYFCDGVGSVFDSQVLTLLNGIHDNSVFKKIYLFLGIRDENQKLDFLKKKLTPEIEVVFFKSYANYPLVNHLSRKSIKSALFSQGINLKEIIFHTRGELIARHLSSILESRYHKHIVPDIRGASIEEIKEFYDMNKIQKFFKTHTNKLALQNLNRFVKMSVVSVSLKEYLIKNYKVNSEKIFITPSLAAKDFIFNEEQREKVRFELNLNERDMLIVFSSGGTANWQNNDPLKWLADKGFKILNLSKKKISHKNIINKFVSYSEMPAHLNAADVAIIWRDKSIVNEAASPVKFSEYICCGLPVIANKNVDMINKFIRTYSCGLLIDSFEDIDIDSLRGLSQMDRKNISDKGKKYFGINTIINSYLNNYSSINNL